MTVQEGDVAPDFEMPATGTRTVSKKALRGKPFVLYFYPKADTPGCTKEACAFQEALPQLGHIGIDVIGVSPDKMKPIEKFAEKYSLTFPLASDEAHAVAEKVRHLGREVDVWTQVYGHGAQHVPDRQSRQNRQGLAQGQRDRTCRGRAGGRAGTEVVATEGDECFLLSLAGGAVEPHHPRALDDRDLTG